MPFFSGDVQAVQLNDEVRRVEKLERRQWTDEQAGQMVDRLTEFLRTPRGEQRLRRAQAVALAEIGMYGGLFGPIRVGAGKTLVTLLAPTVADAKRPLLVIPAKLRDKTQRDRVLLSRHWRFPELRVMTYEWLGRVQAAEALTAYQPDLLIFDEAHRIRNRRAAVTRRVLRYLRDRPGVKCVFLSGTATKRSLLDYAHMLRAALGEGGMPVPKTYGDLEAWADALDERKGQVRRADPGALQVFCNEDELRQWYTGDDRGAARRAFRRRLIDTPGVVATQESQIDASLIIAKMDPPASPLVDAAFERLRKEWETPDGWPLSDGLEIYRHAREIALGLYYRWDPRPPRSWLDARRAWSSYVRKVLSGSRSLDSELQVRRAFPDSPELRAWLAVRDSFKPVTVPVWLDDSVLKACADWLDEEQGLVWTEHVHFAEKLAELTKVPYHGRGGLDARGRSVEERKPGEPMILSQQSNSEGRNLQAWSVNLVTSFPPNGLQAEQLLGRCHRDGQQADEVEFRVAAFCAEHVGAFWQARRDAEYVEQSTGAQQKILLAGHDMPTADELCDRTEWRWKK